MTHHFMMLATAGVLVASGGASAQAPLNLISTNPDVASGFISISYNATTHLFTATGSTQNVTIPPTSGLGFRLFTISASIGNDGSLLSNVGNLEVRGDFGGTDQLLFQSTTINAFGYNVGNIFEFLFVQQAGSLAAPFSSVGTILVGDGLSFPGGVPTFTSNFSLSFTGRANTFLPAPGAAVLAGLGGLVAARRRRD